MIFPLFRSQIALSEKNSCLVSTWAENPSLGSADWAGNFGPVWTLLMHSSTRIWDEIRHVMDLFRMFTGFLFNKIFDILFDKLLINLNTLIHKRFWWQQWHFILAWEQWQSTSQLLIVFATLTVWLTGRFWLTDLNFICREWASQSAVDCCKIMNNHLWLRNDCRCPANNGHSRWCYLPRPEYGLLVASCWKFVATG